MALRRMRGSVSAQIRFRFSANPVPFQRKFHLQAVPFQRKISMENAVIHNRQEASMERKELERKNLEQIITEHLAIEAEDAKKAGNLGYMARAFVQATLPHKATISNEFTEKMGCFL